MKPAFVDRYPLVALCLFKLGLLLAFLSIGSSFVHGETLDEQVTRMKAQIDSLNCAANALAGTKYAARMDSLVAADPVLTATHLHLRATSRDSSYVVVDLDSCSVLQRQIIRGALNTGEKSDLYYEGEELWIRWRAFERIALPALKRDLQ